VLAIAQGGRGPQTVGASGRPHDGARAPASGAAAPGVPCLRTWRRAPRPRPINLPAPAGAGACARDSYGRAAAARGGVPRNRPPPAPRPLPWFSCPALASPPTHNGDRPGYSETPAAPAPSPRAALPAPRKGRAAPPQRPRAFSSGALAPYAPLPEHPRRRVPWPARGAPRTLPGPSAPLRRRGHRRGARARGQDVRTPPSASAPPSPNTTHCPPTRPIPIPPVGARLPSRTPCRASPFEAGLPESSTNQEGATGAQPQPARRLASGAQLALPPTP
jgi:hypothetical protein